MLPGRPGMYHVIGFHDSQLIVAICLRFSSLAYRLLNYLFSFWLSFLVFSYSIYFSGFLRQKAYLRGLSSLGMHIRQPVWKRSRQSAHLTCVSPYLSRIAEYPGRAVLGKIFLYFIVIYKNVSSLQPIHNVGSQGVFEVSIGLAWLYYFIFKLLIEDLRRKSVPRQARLHAVVDRKLLICEPSRNFFNFSRQQCQKAKWPGLFWKIIMFHDSFKIN